MDLNALADFNVVVVHGGFGRASRATGRPKASLSRRVMQLEHSLGVRLFQRGSRSLVLTEEGAALHASTASGLDELKEAAEAISTRSQSPSGRLRISAPTLFAYESLGRLAAAYIAAYPEVVIEIVAEDRFVNPITDDYDVVIRANPAPDSALAGRCFLHDELVVVASPLVKNPSRAAAEELSVAAVTLLSAPVKERWRVAGVDGERILLPQAVARFSSISMVRDAALAGAGAAVLPLSRVRDELENGKLAMWGTLQGRSVEVWALFASRRHLSPKIRTFVALLSESFLGADSKPVWQRAESAA